jgi:O-antigen/teichoic acid export membrane protein
VSDPAAVDSSGLAVRLAANTLVLAAGNFLGSLIAFFTFVAVTRGLGPETYGHLTAATAYLFIPTVLAEAGLSAAILREISGRPERTEPAMRASLPLRTAVGLAFVAFATALAVFLPFDHETKVAIAISSIGAFLTLLSLSLLPVLQSQLKMQWAVAGNLAGRVVALVLTLAVLAADYGLEGAVTAQVIGIAVTFLVHLVVVARLVSLRPMMDVPYWRSLAATSVVLGLAIALGQIYFRIDALLLAVLRDATEVGLYGAAFKFLELAEFFVAAFGLSLFPPLTRFVATRDVRAPALVQKAFDLVIATAAAIAVGLFVFAEDIILVTAGPEFRDSAVALQILAPYVLFSFANGIFWRVLMASERDRRLLAVSSSVLVFNVALNLALIPEFGYKAAAATSVISEAAITVPMVFAVRRERLLPGLRYLPVVATAAAAMGLVGWFVDVPALIAGALAGAAYLAVLLALPGTARSFVFGDLLPALRRS